MHSRMLAAAAAATLMIGASAGPVRGQIRGSEAGSVSQTVDGTTLSVAYHRPSARGRTLFGELMPWNVVWTPGANWSTTLDVDRDVRLNGTEVLAGRYSVWMTPRETGSWTLSLNPQHRLFHYQKPDSTGDQIHIAVAPETASHVEMLTWSFPAVSGDAAVLELRWGRTAVPIEVLVPPTKPVTLVAEDRAPFLGRYAIEFMDGVPWPRAGELVVTEKDGHLRGHLPFPLHPGDELEFDLVPAGRDRFHAGLYHDGTLFNIEMAFAFEFDVSGERATAVVVRGIEGTAFGEGARAASAAGEGG